MVKSFWMFVYDITKNKKKIFRNFANDCLWVKIKTFALLSKKKKNET